MAEAIATNLSKYSSTDNYSPEFQKVKMLKEKGRLDASSKNEKEYKLPFSITDLKQSQRTNDSATGSDCSLFVDDFVLCGRSKSMNRVERAMQLCVNNVQDRVSENGFKFFTSKTVRYTSFHQQYDFSRTLTS